MRSKSFISIASFTLNMRLLHKGVIITQFPCSARNHKGNKAQCYAIK